MSFRIAVQSLETVTVAVSESEAIVTETSSFTFHEQPLPGYVDWRPVAAARISGRSGRVRVEAAVDVLEGRRAAPSSAIERERVSQGTTRPAFAFAANREYNRAFYDSL